MQGGGLAKNDSPPTKSMSAHSIFISMNTWSSSHRKFYNSVKYLGYISREILHHCGISTWARSLAQGWSNDQGLLYSAMKCWEPNTIDWLQSQQSDYRAYWNITQYIHFTCVSTQLTLCAELAKWSHELRKTESVLLADCFGTFRTPYCHLEGKCTLDESLNRLSWLSHRSFLVGICEMVWLFIVAGPLALTCSKIPRPF